MFHTLIRQPYAKTILFSFALLVLLGASTAAENVTRATAQQTSEVFRTSQVSEPAAPALAPEARPAASRTIQYTYDNAGRLINANYGGAKSVAYTYDNAGNLLRRTGRGQSGVVSAADRAVTGFTVRELRSGTSNATFDSMPRWFGHWEVAARRKGYEDVRLAPFTPGQP
jgi:YD repeat-containing protein